MTIIKQMLEKHEIKTSEDKINALKEVVPRNYPIGACKS